MRYAWIFMVVLTFPGRAVALADHTVDRIVIEHVLPGYEALATATRELYTTANADCTPSFRPLRDAYHAAFDAWVMVSHLRFGPSEVDSRAFAIAFWPDPRGKTPKTLRRMLADRDPSVSDPSAFATLSVAGRGLYALERVLFDPEFSEREEEPFICKLVMAIAHDLAATSAQISSDWRDRYADQMIRAGRHGSIYRAPLEAQQEFLKALSTGLQFTSELRLGRPLGTFERPRPKRAEARLSGRSLRNVQLALVALQSLALKLSKDHPDIAAGFDAGFATAIEVSHDLDHDPVFKSVSDPQGRLKVEVLQQRIDDIRSLTQNRLGPALGVGEGFNALDGD
ncbi:MAG: imelysin family protein [Pseudomonadota bacterium]